MPLQFNDNSMIMQTNNCGWYMCVCGYTKYYTLRLLHKFHLRHFLSNYLYGCIFFTILTDYGYLHSNTKYFLYTFGMQ